MRIFGTFGELNKRMDKLIELCAVKRAAIRRRRTSHLSGGQELEMQLSFY